jgi:hypothetical protein
VSLLVPILYCAAVVPAVAVFLIAFVSSTGSLLWKGSLLLLPSQLLLVPASIVVANVGSISIYLSKLTNFKKYFWELSKGLESQNATIAAVPTYS